MEKENAIVVEQLVNAPVEKVWRAISNKDEIRNWSFDIDEFEPVKGYEFHFYGGTDAHQYLHQCKVLEVEPNKKLVHSWRYDGYEGDTVVSYQLFAEGSKTLVRLTHEGVETFPKTNPDFARENFVAGWKDIIGVLLKEYVEK